MIQMFFTFGNFGDGNVQVMRGQQERCEKYHDNFICKVEEDVLN